MQNKKRRKLIGFSDGLDLEYERNQGSKNGSRVFGQSEKKFIFTILSLSIQEYDAFAHFCYRVFQSSVGFAPRHVIVFIMS